ncbi:MAG: hypothetical protein AAFQ22_13175 [Pseudomonadota bacterium]
MARDVNDQGTLELFGTPKRVERSVEEPASPPAMGLAGRTACGAASIIDCSGKHPDGGALWCNDCCTTSIRERAERGEIQVIGIRQKQ